MSRYTEHTTRGDNIRWFGLGGLGLLALIAAGLMALDTGALAFSIIVFLSLGGALTLGAAVVALAHARLAAVSVAR